MLAWLPYADTDELTERIGALPDGVEWESISSEKPHGDRAGEVGFYVQPYLAPSGVLDPIAEWSSLEVVQIQSAGYDNLLDSIPEQVTLCNAAGVHDASTAELAIALALANGRRLDTYARQQANREWNGIWGSSLAEKRVLILGYGRIGKAVEARLAGFEVGSITKVASRARDDIHGTDELPELLPQADVVVIIAPHTPQTDKIMNAETLALLPDDALVINVARGKLVDTDALLAECSSGRLRAGLDVTDPEPLPTDHPLWTCPGVTISPHVGGASSAFPPRTNKLIAAQLRRWATGEPMEHVVKPGRRV